MFKFLLFLSFFLMIGDVSAQVVTYDRAADFLAVIEPDVLIGNRGRLVGLCVT